MSKQALFTKLHEEYKVVNNPSVYTAFRKGSANAVALGNFTTPKENKSTLLTIDNQAVSVNQFSEYILLNQTVGSDIDAMYISFVNEQLLAYEESQLEAKYPEYKALLKEYREGILLFDLTNEKVWTKAVEDTVGLQNYYNANSSNYMWENRVNATMYSCMDLATARYVKKAIYKKHRESITDAEILTIANTNSPLSLQISTKKFAKGENEYVDAVDWKIGIAGDIKTKEGSYIIIDIHEVLAAGVKKLSETRGKVISDYQNTLEAEWITSLQEKYAVTINKEVLYTLLKQ